MAEEVAGIVSHDLGLAIDQLDGHALPDATLDRRVLGLHTAVDDAHGRAAAGGAAAGGAAEGPVPIDAIKAGLACQTRECVPDEWL